MKSSRSVLNVLALFLMLLLACAPLGILSSGGAATGQAPAVATATLVTVSTEAPPTATLQPIVLSGPPMEVGSMWPYVDGSILVAVPGGDFTMGHGGSDNPEHTIALSDYWIYQGKVTNQQYALCVQAGECDAPDPIDDFTFNDVSHANDPVVGVTWKQASDYCSFVHGHLPTEAEWEKTARGPDGNLYPWGNGDPSCDYLNFNNCVGKITDTTKYPQGQSYYHALDMEGNVFEWASDWYEFGYYKVSPPENPLGPDTGRQRSVRSSSYKSKADETPASTRRYDFPNSHRRDLGFRCVVEDPTWFAPLCTSIGLFGTGPSGSSSSSGKADCPKVNIGLSPVCQQGKVTVVITDDHSPDPNASISGVSQCKAVSVPGKHSFPQVYDCFADTTVQIDTTCEPASSGPVQCGAHYNLNTSTGQCEWDGTGTQGGQCLPGMTYNPVNQCCSAQSGSAGNYSICPLGTALGYKSGQPVCVPGNQAVNPISHPQTVHIQDPKTCTGGGGNPGGGCQQTCTPPLYLDPNTCNCVGRIQ